MELQNLVVFSVAEQRFALNLANVQRIVRAVEVTPLPGAPDIILGVINVEGQIIPVMDSRRRLGINPREIELSDLFIIVQEGDLTLALVADEVKPVMEIPEAQVARSDRMLAGQGMVHSVAKVDDGMIVVLSLAGALSSEDHRKVTTALEEIEVG